jgi:RNase adaptor protein for sRNA GlmZ degradation
MGSHREDVDDAARLAGLNQVGHHALHDEKWTTHVCIEVPIPDLDCRIEQVAAIGCCGRVHQAVDTAEMLQTRIDQPMTIIDDRHVCLDE